jgi:aspartate carbamoyltransferase catalytic subunit
VITTWPHRHLLDVDGLTRDELRTVLDMAVTMADQRGAPGATLPLAGRTVATLFAEPSTRTRVSFELAARALGGDPVSLDAANSSLAKGESLIDTVRTLQALGASMLVIRHPRSGAPQLASEHFGGPVLNAGDGWHAHPTQALLDLYTLRQVLGDDRLSSARVCIVGDVLHSRVARSDIWALTCWGVDVRLTGPTVFLRGFEAWARALPSDRKLTVTGDLAAGIAGADAVMALRVQRERLEGAGAPSEAAYAARWGLTEERLARFAPDSIVMHPGPVNEGVELPPDVAAGPRSVITRQVANGVPVRMAAMALLAGAPRASAGAPPASAGAPRASAGAQRTTGTTGVHA